MRDSPECLDDSISIFLRVQEEKPDRVEAPATLASQVRTSEMHQIAVSQEVLSGPHGEPGQPGAAGKEGQRVCFVQWSLMGNV